MSLLLMLCVRAPIDKNKYLQGKNYGTGRQEYLWPEKFWAAFTDDRIKARGDRGGVYFTDKRKLDNGFRYDPENLITLNRSGVKISAKALSFKI